jgi:hypothetical protein
MTFDVTTFLAIWGAILSSFAVGWNIYRDFSDKGRLKVDCYVGKHIVPGIGVVQDNILVWTITNVGKRPVILAHVGGAFRKEEFILTTKTILPHKIEPGEYILENTNDLKILEEDVIELFAIDTIGNKYNAPNKRLKQALKSAKDKVKKNT